VGRALWIALLLVLSEPALAQDAGADGGTDADAAPAAGVVDFTDDGLAGGEELSSPSLQPLKHESLLPDRYRGRTDAGPAPARPPSPRGRGCAGCEIGSDSSVPPDVLWLAAVAALGLRRKQGTKN